MDLYLLLKYLHVLLAVVAVGFNASYAIWLRRAARNPEHIGFALRGVKFLDDRVANPAYGLLLASGLSMVWVGQLSITTFWIAASLVLWVVLLVLGLFFYTPVLRDQILALEKGGADSPEFRRLDTRGTVVGLMLMILVLVIIFLMVVKPVL